MARTPTVPVPLTPGTIVTAEMASAGNAGGVRFGQSMPVEGGAMRCEDKKYRLHDAQRECARKGPRKCTWCVYYTSHDP